VIGQVCHIKKPFKFYFLEYKKVCNHPGDHFYIRVHFDRTAENHGELSFQKNDILLVESTIHEGKLGHWFAWLVGVWRYFK
jgi:hypothetical protein